MENEKLPVWWGYLHIHGTVHIKRYFGPEDLDGISENPFVKYYVAPIKAPNLESATDTIKALLSLQIGREDRI